MRGLADEAPDAVAAERFRVATEGWGAKLLAHQSRAGNFGSPQEDGGLLVTLFSLVVLMDLGLDPASKPGGKMIDRVDKRLVSKPLNNRPFLHGETEPCINGRILAIGAYFNKPNNRLANQLLGQQLEDGGWNCEAVEPSPKTSAKPTLFVPHHHLRTPRVVRSRTSGSQIGGRHEASQERRKVPARSPLVPLAANRRGSASAAAFASRS